MDYKSPFLIIKELLSPLQCEDMILRLKHTSPNTDQRGNPTVTYKGNRLSEIRIENTFKDVIPELENYYSFNFKTLTSMLFEWYPTGFTGLPASCEAYSMINKRGKSAIWQKIKDYDFTVVIFLNSYNDDQFFDERFEVRGGKLGFPTHDFGFNPERGSAIVFPCRPNFVNAVGPIEVGNLNMVKFHIITKGEYEYNMNDFPGGYKEWFDV